jgi:hypothetical protein
MAQWARCWTTGRDFRPRRLDTGPDLRHYVPLDARPEAGPRETEISGPL